MRSIGGVEHADAGSELGEVEVAAEVHFEGHRPDVGQGDVP